MKNGYILPVLFLMLYSICILPACRRPSNASEEIIGNWTTAPDFRGDPRSDAAAFVIGNTAYVLTGTTDRGAYNDMYAFDIISGTWSKKPPLPAEPRNGAVAFTINGKGYVGTGYNSKTVLAMQDFWEYDPVAQTWTAKDDIPAEARYDAIGVTIGLKGYVYGGCDGKAFNDCWEFDPTQPAGLQWKEMATAPRKTRAAVAFVLKDKAYVLNGSNNGEIQKELYEFDPGLNKWTIKRPIYNYSNESYDDKYTSIVRQNAVAFTLNNYGYITAGVNGSYVSSTWQYDADADTWKEKTGFEAKGRESAVAFAVNNRAFVLTGNNGSLYMDNMFEFFPDAVKVDGD